MRVHDDGARWVCQRFSIDHLGRIKSVGVYRPGSDLAASLERRDRMNMILLFVGAVIIACILLKPIAAKLPFPTLLIFIALGMFLGSGGPLHINFNDFEATESVCTAALIFIMFYGGFNTNIERARPVAVPAVLLSTAGVVITAGLTAVFAHVALRFDWPLALLLGSVISSTDAASVFSVLREHRLSLKGGTDSLLEVESGSNDPLAYMLTAVFSALALGEAVNLPVLIAQQIVFGAAFGLAFGWVGMKLVCRMNLESQNETIVLIAIALLSFAVPSQLGGNGFLSVYLAGIVLGASVIPSKREMVHVFDVLTEMAEMAIFFLIGLLVTPARLPQAILPALGLVLFMLFIGRPVAVCAIMPPRRGRLGQIGLVSWAGLRGAASVVFALFTVVSGVPGSRDLFDLVFMVAIISIVMQGSLLPAVAKRLKMIDEAGDVSRTFNDYQEETDLSFIKLKVDAGHPFAGRSLAQIGEAASMLVVLILRHGAEPVIPNGDTVIETGDLLVLAAPTFEERAGVSLREHHIGEHHHWAGCALHELPHGGRRFIVVLLKREGETIIPNGDTQLLPGDDVVIATLG